MALTVFLDLDRTLFQTDLFDELRWELLAQWYPEVIDLPSEWARQREFYVYHGELYFYDFTAHMAALGLEVDEVYERLRTSELADGRLEYEGVRALVEWIRERGDVRILTFGPEDYQSLKLALCPSLRDVPVHRTLEEKGGFFRSLAHDAADEVWMVDDKLIPELPEYVHYVQADVEQKGVEQQGWAVVTDLAELPGVIAVKK